MSLDRHCSELSRLKFEPCIPPFWARSGHAQTLWGHFLPSRIKGAVGERIEIVLADGDRLVGTHHKGKGPLTVYLFHGLGGSSDVDYMQRTAQVSTQLDCPVILVNHRGFGEGAGLARGPFHSGRIEDLSAVIQYGRALYPLNAHVAVGFSLSGNMLLLMLGKKKGQLPDYAIAVNPSIELENSSITLGRGFNRIYDLSFSRLLRQTVRQKQRIGLWTKPIHFSPLMGVREFDEAYTAREGGFLDRAQYYTQCSSISVLSEVQVPTVLLSTRDDPIVNYQLFVRCKLSPSVHLHLEEHGGHLGYLTKSKTPLGTRRWLDYAMYRYLQFFRKGV